eukprot:jgi/Psemu1/180992/e_gw1.18.84.1
MLQTDHLNVIAHHLHNINNVQDLWQNKYQWPLSIDSLEATEQSVRICQLTQRKLQGTAKWDGFLLQSEWKQLDIYHKVGMLGDPIPHTSGMTVLLSVWTYGKKEDPLTGDTIQKSRGTCNGGKRYGKAVTLAQIYAACIKQPVHRVTWAIAAAMNLICVGYNIGDAFAEAPAPQSPFYIKVDAHFKQWWTEHLRCDPVPVGHVIPIHKALQGHPESP